MALAVSVDVTWTAGNRDEMVPHTYLPPHFSGAKETVMVHFMYRLTWSQYRDIWLIILEVSVKVLLRRN